jgi:outer membrane receptor for ferric coprogen and ferric-rhodotorulic acid
VELHTDKGIVFKQALTDLTQTVYFAVDAKEDAAFYRVEVVNVTTGLMHALGNPIWNTK